MADALDPFPMTPDRFAEILAAVKQSTEVSNFTQMTPTSGSFSASLVDLSYSYTPNNLSVTVTGRRGKAHLMPASFIRQEIAKMLGE